MLRSEMAWGRGAVGAQYPSNPQPYILDNPEKKSHVEVGDGLGKRRSGGPIAAALKDGARHLVARHPTIACQQQHLAMRLFLN